jgi:hypothetical protein
MGQKETKPNTTEHDRDQDIHDLATAVESIVAAILIGDRDAETARRLLKDAGALAAAIRGASTSASAAGRHDA